MISSPSNGAEFDVDDTLTITCSFPETPQPGSVRLIFRNTDAEPDEDYTLVMVNSASVSFSLNLKNLSGTASYVTSATGPGSAPITSVPDGNYTAILSYQDLAQNAAASASCDDCIPRFGG